MNDLIVLLPAYNEEDNIQIMFEKWEDQREKLKTEYMLGLRIIIIDDGSSDRTAEIAGRLEKEKGGLTLIRHARNKGLGGAVKTGIVHFIENCGDSRFMCIMDCDNTQDPKYISSMLDSAINKKSDVVIASRYQKGAEVKGVTGIRLLMSQGAKLVFSLILNIPNVKDYTCGYRLYGRDSLVSAKEKFGDKLVEENGFTCMVELLYKLYICGAKISEVPFRLRYDKKGGASKMSVIKTAMRSMLLALHLRKLSRSR